MHQTKSNPVQPQCMRVVQSSWKVVTLLIKIRKLISTSNKRRKRANSHNLLGTIQKMGKALPMEPQEANHDRRASYKMKAKIANTAKKAKARRSGKQWLRMEWASSEKIAAPRIKELRRGRDKMKTWREKTAARNRNRKSRLTAIQLAMKKLMTKKIRQHLQVAWDHLMLIERFFRVKTI